METQQSISPVVLAILVKRDEGSDRIIVNTQKRHSTHPSYDNLNAETWECVGGKVDGVEFPHETIWREIAEETGATGQEMSWMRILSTEAKIHTTGREDAIHFSTPICYVHSMGEPQPWAGPVFVVQVATDFEPRESTDGEASPGRWWTAEELHEAIEERPLEFMNLHAPALSYACLLIMNNQLIF